MSNYKVVGIIVATVALLGGGALLANMSSDDKTTDTSNSTDTSMDMSKDTSSDTSASSSSEATATSTVEIKSYAFTPANITVKKGAKVTWTNQDAVGHTVTDDGSGSGLDSAVLQKGDSYSFTFDKVGTFKYLCTPHPYMKATVTVTE